MRADLQKYRDMLDTLPNRNLICGFVCAKKELLNWEPSDLFQFYYDTTPIKGTLDILLEKIDKQAVFHSEYPPITAVAQSINNFDILSYSTLAPLFKFLAISITQDASSKACNQNWSLQYLSCLCA